LSSRITGLSCGQAVDIFAANGGSHQVEAYVRPVRLSVCRQHQENRNSDHQKLYCCARFLLPKLPNTQETRKVQVDDKVERKFYRLQKINEWVIDL